MLRCLMKSGSVVLLGFLFTLGSSAQTTNTGSVTGVVTSQSGSPMANATVTVQNTGDNSTQQTTTDTTGKYRFDNLTPGSYRMSTTNQGVTSSPSDAITLAAGEVATVNLTIGNTAANTTPAATGPPTNPVTSVEQATSSQDLVGPRIRTGWNQRNIQYLPAPNFLQPDGRDYSSYNLSLFSAGVASNDGVGPGNGPVVGGQRPYENDFMVGGMDNNNRWNPGPLAYISNDSAEEFQVEQNQFDPEYGHAAGGQMNVLAREGNNALHGELYEYFQNQNLDAVDATYIREGLSGIPRYDQNRVGGNAGFPIIKNRLFFFGDFEYIPLGFDSVPGSAVFAPTAAGYGLLAGMAGVSPSNLSYLQRALPAANFATTSTMLDGISVPVGVSPILGKGYQNQYNGVASLDWKLGGNDQMLMRYVHNDIHSSSIAGELSAFFTPQTTRVIIASLGEVHTFSSGAVNELRLSYNRDDSHISFGPNSFTGLGYAPTISIEQDLGATLGSGLFAPSFAALSTYSLADTVHWTHGHHQLRIGYDGRRYIGPIGFGAAAGGAFTYSSLGNFLTNLPPDVYGSRAVGSTTLTTNQWDSYAFIRDDWAVTPDLTIDIGARYEFVGLPQFMKYQDVYGDLSVPGVINFRAPKAQSDAWAPTVGLAFAPGVVKNSVFRAGFGMNYDATAYTSLLPFYYSGGANSISTAGLSAVPGFFGGMSPFFGSGAGVGAAGISTYFPNQTLPYSMQWNASWEQQVLSRFLLNVRYLGVRGVHLPNVGLLNETSTVTAANSLPLYYTAPSQATLNGLTTTLGSLAPANSLAAYGFTNPIFEMNDSGSSTYNGLQVQATQRFSGGFQMVAAYTWSHLIDDVSTPLLLGGPSFVPLEALGPRESSIYDHRQRGTLTALWDLGGIGPNGFRWWRDIAANMNISGTYVYETAAPVPYLSGFDTGLTGFSNSGVIYNPSGTAGIGSGVSPLTNSFGQTVAYQVTNPNAQYIAGAPGVYTGSGRNFFFGRPINNFDASVAKRFGIRDRFSIEFRADAFNILNHPQYTPGQLTSVGLPVASSLNFLMPGSPAFGDPTMAFSSHPRILQLSAKVVF